MVKDGKAPWFLPADAIAEGLELEAEAMELAAANKAVQDRTRSQQAREARSYVIGLKKLPGLESLVESLLANLDSVEEDLRKSSETEAEKDKDYAMHVRIGEKVAAIRDDYGSFAALGAATRSIVELESWVRNG